MEIIHLRERADLEGNMAEWFHSKWKIPAEAYLESMEECRKKKDAVPQWYAVMEGSTIVGGAGVIENDFHDRKDLRPNVCALYVEEEFRNQGIAGKLLAHVCSDMEHFGIPVLYLITDHTSFYERYGWEFYCMVHEDGAETPVRVYRHRQAFDSSSR